MKSNLKIWINRYDDAADAAAAAAATAAAAAAAAAAGGGGTPKTFTQDDVNRLLAKEKRDFQSKQQTMINELEALKQKSTLTAEERTALENRLEELRNESLTKDELAKKDKDKLLKTHETEKTTLVKERDGWRNRYTDATIARALTDAAVANTAHVPSQIVSILRGQTRLVEELDEAGKPNGNLIPKVTLQDKDKDGKSVTLDLTVSEAVKRMKDMEDYFNLFKGEGTGGVGGTNRGGGSGTTRLTDVAADPLKYREARKKGITAT